MDLITISHTTNKINPMAYFISLDKFGNRADQ
jgi:hypothetical protein